MRARPRSIELLLLFCVSCATSSDSTLPSGSISYRLRTLDDDYVTIGSLRGKVALVSVITTWSDPALFEVKKIRALDEHHPEVEVLYIALDENLEMVRIFRDAFGIPYTIAYPEDRSAFTGPNGPFGPITIIPTSFLIDRHGKIAARSEGTWPPGFLARAVSNLIEQR